MPTETPLEALRSRVIGLQTEVKNLADADDAAWNAVPEADRDALRARGEFAIAEFSAAKAELDAGIARAKALEAVRTATVDEIPGVQSAPNVQRSQAEIDLRTASRSELRDAALRILETDGKRLAPHQGDHVDSLLRGRELNADGATIARMMLVTETDAYRSGFQKATTGRGHLTQEEGAALDAYRAANEGTGSAGGFGIPVLIDPSIILTSGAIDAPILDIARVVTITTDAWKGVSAAAVSWSYDAEASAVSDDTPTLAQPNVPVYAARGFVPYSIEVGEDYPGFAEEMANLMAQGYVDLLASQTVVGSGSSSPRGIFTAAAATTTNPAHTTVTTAGSLSATDLRNVYSALPERFRSKASWVMSPTVEQKVSQFGNALALSDYTVNLLADGTHQIAGKPVVVSDYAPAFSSTTGSNNFTVVGDFSTGFLIVQRAGMTVELVEHLFDTSTGRPTGQRGWFAYARHGFDVIVPNAFRLLSNS
jgi:HK97 family phage major capsid protein